MYFNHLLKIFALSLVLSLGLSLSSHNEGCHYIYPTVSAEADPANVVVGTVVVGTAVVVGTVVVGAAVVAAAAVGGAVAASVAVAAVVVPAPEDDPKVKVKGAADEDDEDDAGTLQWQVLPPLICCVTV